MFVVHEPPAGRVTCLFADFAAAIPPSNIGAVGFSLAHAVVNANAANTDSFTDRVIGNPGRDPRSGPAICRSRQDRMAEQALTQQVRPGLLHVPPAHYRGRILRISRISLHFQPLSLNPNQLFHVALWNASNGRRREHNCRRGGWSNQRDAQSWLRCRNCSEFHFHCSRERRLSAAADLSPRSRICWGSTPSTGARLAARSSTNHTEQVFPAAPLRTRLVFPDDRDYQLEYW